MRTIRVLGKFLYSTRSSEYILVINIIMRAILSATFSYKFGTKPITILSEKNATTLEHLQFSCNANSGIVALIIVAKLFAGIKFVSCTKNNNPPEGMKFTVVTVDELFTIFDVKYQNMYTGAYIYKCILIIMKSRLKYNYYLILFRFNQIS